VRQQKERDYQAKMRELQRLQRDYDEDLRRKDRELSERILRNLEAIIKKMGEEGQYTLILERNQPTVIYISNVLDLTEEVIKRIDKKQK
jgi:outer membrane protein